MNPPHPDRIKVRAQVSDRHVLTSDRASVLRCFERGNRCLDQGRLSEAERSFRKALQFAPEAPELWSNLGIAMLRAGKLAEAESCLIRALTLRPDYVEARINLAAVLEALGNLDEALAQYRHAVSLSPEHARVRSALGGMLLRLGRFDQALVQFARAVKLAPTQADDWVNLGSTMLAIGNITESEKFLRCAVAIAPSHQTAQTSLGDFLRLQGKFDEAVSAYRKAITTGNATDAQQVKLALAQEVIFDSRESALKRRAEVAESLDALARKGVRLDDPAREVGMTNFYFAYHGLNDVDLQKRIAEFYLRTCPKLDWTAPHCIKPQRPEDSRLRLGIVSTCLFDHTIGKFYHGIVQKLSRKQFEVIVLRPPHNDDALAAAVGRDADRAIELPHDLYSARQRIAEEKLDILLYPEIGMVPLTYFLAFARLALVQSVGWGHPVTTGIPTVDYFISSKTVEAATAETHYSERLAMLERLPTFYPRPVYSAPPFTRAEFGFEENATLYLCPQSLFKLHPDFDPVMATLLRRDPRGRLLLISGLHRQWDRLLAARFARGFPDVADRVAFVPRIPKAEFFRLLTMADAVLDPPYFGGGNTTYEAFAVGVPIVTWPGEFMRGRVTYGCYRQMGYTELVASDLDSYVELALRLAHDSEWREGAKREIEARADALYDDMAAITQLEDFLTAAWRASMRGERISA